jgi:hemerythrin
MKTIIEWEERYAVSDRVIDNQHKVLFNIINKLYRAVLSSVEKEVIEEIIEELVDYSFVHFEHEEKLFDKFDYENTDEHIKEHEGFICKIKEFEDKITNKDSKLPLEVLNYLKTWIINHILVSDKKYVGKIEE